MFLPRSDHVGTRRELPKESAQTQLHSMVGPAMKSAPGLRYSILFCVLLYMITVGPMKFCLRASSRMQWALFCGL